MVFFSFFPILWVLRPLKSKLKFHRIFHSSCNTLINFIVFWRALKIITYEYFIKLNFCAWIYAYTLKIKYLLTFQLVWSITTKAIFFLKLCPSKCHRNLSSIFTTDMRNYSSSKHLLLSRKRMHMYRATTLLFAKDTTRAAKRFKLNFIIMYFIKLFITYINHRFKKHLIASFIR